MISTTGHENGHGTREGLEIITQETETRRGIRSISYTTEQLLFIFIQYCESLACVPLYTLPLKRRYAKAG
jgi:hypothetical protein